MSQLNYRKEKASLKFRYYIAEHLYLESPYTLFVIRFARDSPNVLYEEKYKEIKSSDHPRLLTRYCNKKDMIFHTKPVILIKAKTSLAKATLL